jgi:2-keto-4-pentenoate hydratase/2-oxohepta-3-ene-1,7-dioic acid hydratase in catechol pathway
MRYVYRTLIAGEPRHVVDEKGRTRLVEGDLFGEWRAGREISLAGAVLLPPVVPGKIVAIGLNYRDHAAERGKPLPAEPMIFLKPSTAVVGPGAPIQVPAGVGRVDHEAEVAVVVGRRATAVPAAGARAHVLGLTCINDVTARDLQNRGVQYSHVKGYDTFAPLGPAIALDVDPGDLAVEGVVNGVVRQRSRTRELIFPVEALIEYISGIMTLEPGDVIATGTPSGIGPLVPGDEVVVRVERVGELRNPVIAR